ncbi:MAG: DUF6088 family protein [Verrucomicrobiota bacterium]|nr:DUF6088 family protein [Verrucomicrobiota bacterium]
MESIEDKAVKRVYANHRGWAFSKNDFLDIGGDDSIRQALTNLEAKGTVRRVFRGLYDYPRVSKLIGGPMEPDLRQVAQALARKSGWRIQPSENTALNILGLSTQVPVQAVYLSDGPSKTFLIGKRELTFKKRILKESGFKHSESELIVQALKALGQKRITAEIRKKLKAAIPLPKWEKILRDTRTAPAWVCDVIRAVAKEMQS